MCGFLFGPGGFCFAPGEDIIYVYKEEEKKNKVATVVLDKIKYKKTFFFLFFYIDATRNAAIKM